MLRDYEILYIARPDLDDEQLNDAVRKVTELIGNLGGRHQNTNIWGRRRLAYEVGPHHEGHYVLTDFEIEPARVPELEATLKISDTVFRHLVVRKPPRKAGTPAAATATPPAAAVGDGEGAGADEPEDTTTAGGEAVGAAAHAQEETLE